MADASSRTSLGRRKSIIDKAKGVFARARTARSASVKAAGSPTESPPSAHRAPNAFSAANGDGGGGATTKASDQVSDVQAPGTLNGAAASESNGSPSTAEEATVRQEFVSTTTNRVSSINGERKQRKRLILNAFVEMCSGHQSPGLWRHPDDRSMNFHKLKHWTDLAQLLEKGKFHGMFIADVLGGYDVYGGPRNLLPAVRSGAQWPVHEPLAVVPAMAAVTESLGFGVTVTTTYEQPYHLARRLSTIDHLTDGRLAWNVVTGYLDSAARNLNPDGSEQLDHDERYAKCEEYMDIVYKLWNSSWSDDAVTLNPSAGPLEPDGQTPTGIYSDPDRVREIGHKGKYYTVPGPHICAPSPQRTPMIMQAGTSKAGRAFAARHAEAVFVSGHSPAACASSIADIRKQAQSLGRDPKAIKFLAKICPILGRTPEEAQDKYREYLSYGSYEGALALFGGWTGTDMAQYGDNEELRLVPNNAIRSYIEGLMKHAPLEPGKKWTKQTLAEHVMVGGLGATPVGTPEQVADEFEKWVDEADVDGFNIAYAIFPGTFEDVIELLVPELRRRGIFWNDYAVPGGTYRENLYEIKGQTEPPVDHVSSRYIWRAGQPPPLPEQVAIEEQPPTVSKRESVHSRKGALPQTNGFFNANLQNLRPDGASEDARGRREPKEEPERAADEPTKIPKPIKQKKEEASRLLAQINEIDDSLDPMRMQLM